jgi:transposase
MRNCKTKYGKSGSRSALISVGVDVAKDTVTICELYKDGKRVHKVIKNSEVSFKRIAGALKGDRFSGKIIMESTGRHHLIGAVVLAEHGLDVRVINPLLAKKYSSASIRKVKTDKRDSEVLAEIGIKEERLPLTFSLSRETLALRKRMRLIYTLSKQLQNLNTGMREHQRTLKSLGQDSSLAEKQLFETVSQLKRRKDHLEKELEKDIRVKEEHADKVKRYDSIPGVSPYVASLAACVFSDEHTQNSKQWIAFTGLDVSVRQSGRWEGKGRLTKRGNDYLRMRFYSAAWGAVMHNKKFREYYDYLRKANRKHREAIIIIARKIVRIMFSLNKKDSFYDPTKPLFTAGCESA